MSDQLYRTSVCVLACINNNDNIAIVASDDAEKAMEIVGKFIEQIPGCSSDDTITAYKVQKIVRDIKFR